MAESATIPSSPHPNVNLVASAARTTSDATAWIPVGGRYDRMSVLLNVSAASGTTPTLNVYIQNRMADGSTVDDIMSFTQKVTTGKERIYYIEANNTTPLAPTDATLAAGSVKAGLIGPFIRVKWVIAGTNPSFTFAVDAGLRSSPL